MITERDPILYIPHGSDESKSHLNSFLQFLRLYIPHGSDESNTFNVTINLFKSLYIPHGSDERDFMIL